MKKGAGILAKRKNGILIAFLVVAIMAGTFVVRAGYLPESVASIIGLSQSPSLTITADARIENNIVLDDGIKSPQPISTLGVFNLIPSATQGSPIYFTSIPIKVEHSSPNRVIKTSNFTLLYQYCLPIGVTPSYGYSQKYGYSAGNCYQASVIPYSVVQNATSGWNIVFRPSWPIMSQAISSKLILKGAVSYLRAPTSKTPNKVRASFSALGANATIDSCENIKMPGYGYGYGNFNYSYGYQPTINRIICNTTSAKIKATSAIGKWLTVPSYIAPKI